MSDMYDFRLKVFQRVAWNLSFTKAAQELQISQPAVTKHITHGCLIVSETKSH